MWIEPQKIENYQDELSVSESVSPWVREYVEYWGAYAPKNAPQILDNGNINMKNGIFCMFQAFIGPRMNI